MALWKWLVEHSFPGSHEEYYEAKRIHLEEMKKYRKNWQFISGLVIYGVALLVLMLQDGWFGKILALCITIGEMLVRDATLEHYCALVNRERKQRITPPAA
jgi:hypothetical protein